MSLLLLLRGEGDYTPPVTDVGFTQPKDVIVRLQALDGTWETCGADRARGVIPEGVQLVSDQWGSKTASFSLRRDPKAVWPDITAFAPVEVEVGGRLVWSGRVSETPVRDSTDTVISVQCEGWQAHLDDDIYKKVYVHTDLTEWRDARSFPNVDLGTWRASGVVESGSGNIVIGWANGANVASNQFVGVALDLGPTGSAKRIVVDWSNQGVAAGSYKFRCQAFDTFSSFFSGETLVDVEPATASSPQAASAVTARRFLALYLVRTGATATETADRKVLISAVQVFADTSYESGNSSVLKADQVVKDALNSATVLISSDQTGVEAGTFSIPEFAPSEPRSAREIWSAVDAFEDRYKKIDVLKRPIYKAKPSTPETEVGAWSGMEFEDSSANSGDDVYSRVIITGTKADGSPLQVARSQGQQSGINLEVVSAPGFTNPSFATNTTGWTAVGGTSTITRDTVTFDSTPASGRWDKTGASDALGAGFSYLQGTTTGTFAKGVAYRIVFRIRASASGSRLQVQFGKPSSDLATAEVTPTTSFADYVLSWTPVATYDGSNVLASLFVDNGLSAGSSYFWIDSLRVERAYPTIIDRRGFLRTKQVATNFTLTDSAAQQIADKWLLAHKTSPFKGRAKLTGNQAVRDIKTGRNIPAEELLLRTGELIRFSDRIDPDTGATGRDGRLVEAQYNADEDTIDITIDSSRAGFEALLERLGVVLGQNRFS